MVTPEHKVKNKVKGILDKHGRDVWHFWPVPGGYGRSTLDCIGIAYGWPFAIETKAPNGKLTKLQEAEIQDIALAGGSVFVIHGTLEELAALEAWLELAKRAPRNTVLPA